MQEKEKNKSIDLTEDSEEAATRSCHEEPTRRNIVSEEAAIRSCHLEPTRRNIVIVIACIKTLST